MAIRNYSNTALPVSLTANVDSLATTLPVNSTAGYPTAPFIIGVERGTANEEVILVAGKTSTTLTGCTRGFDGTTAVSHNSGSPVEHCAAAIDYREANAMVNSFPVPIGAMLPFGAAAAPSGFLLCDGSAVSRTTYAALFAVIGTAYGPGNGTTTFNLPDGRGRGFMGIDNYGAGAAGVLTRTNAIGSKIGAEYVVLDVTQMPVHTHSQQPHTHTQQTHTHTWTGSASVSGLHAHGYGFFRGVWAIPGATDGGLVNGGQGIYYATATTDAGSHTHTLTGSNQSVAPTIDATTATNNNTGGGNAHENVAPAFLGTWIIKAA